MPIYLPPTATYTAIGATSAPTSTSTSFVVIPEMTLTINVQGQMQLVWFTGDFSMVSADAWDFAIFVDSTEQTSSQRHMELQGTAGALGTNTSTPGNASATHALVTGLSYGSHVFSVQWIRTAGTARAVGTQRSLIVEDVF